VVKFGAKVLILCQRCCLQFKRKLWRMVIAIKNEKEYLIGASVLVGIDCLPIPSMINNCSTLDISMLRWIAFIKSLNLEFKHITGKDNCVADMLSRARYDNEEENIGINYFTNSILRRKIVF
jgi:hypothetical protein